MITCYVRYFINPEKVAEFESYAHAWIALIEKYGGTHHGYFVTAATPASATFSFPGIGEEGPPNIGIALFSFPTLADYDSYRQRVAEDPECHKATVLRQESKCFIKYERNFMRRLY
jgi:hypothetical protein